MATGNIVKLNVGGTVFITRRSTLTKYAGFFKALFDSGVPLETDDAGNIFIDRDPTHFGKVLNFMRDGDVDVPDDVITKREILREANYYLLDGLIYLCGGDPSEQWVDANIPFTMLTASNNEEYMNYRQECENKYAIIIIYSEKENKFGDMRQHQVAIDFVKKYRKRWTIVFANMQWNPCVEIKRPEQKWQQGFLVHNKYDIGTFFQVVEMKITHML